MTWQELTQKKVPDLTDSDRVAIAAVVKLSVTVNTRLTMDQIYTELLGTYNHLFSHCDPLPRNGGEARGMEEK